MRIIVIGATGQIGYSLVNALRYTSHEITVLVRDRNRRSFPHGIHILESPVFNTEVFENALQDIVHVIYALGIPEQYQHDTGIFHAVNYDLLKTFLDALTKEGPKKLTYVSTYEVFQAIDGVIRENHPVANEEGFSPYFRSMISAYRLVKEYSDLELTTIHPGAVYGGLNTGDGITNYIENLLNKRYWRVPFVFDGEFPVVHVDSLANAIIAAFQGDGPYIVIDQMTSLRSIAVALKRHADSYVPIKAPVEMARMGATLLEWVSRFTGIKPLMANVQIDFIMNGSEPISERSIHDLGWNPVSLDEGLVKYLGMRPFG
jgi:nucleoside-diphosphate-sugar epimerase